MRRYIDGSVRVIRLTFEAAAGGEVDSAVVKALRLPSLRSAVFAAFNRSLTEWIERTRRPRAVAWPRLAALQMTSLLTPGEQPGKWTDDVLECFAVEALRVHGLGMSTCRHMAEWLREHGHATATEATVRGVMRKAHARGFIAPSTRIGRHATSCPGLGSQLPAPMAAPSRSTDR